VRARHNGVNLHGVVSQGVQKSVRWERFGCGCFRGKPVAPPPYAGTRSESLWMSGSEFEVAPQAADVDAQRADVSLMMRAPTLPSAIVLCVRTTTKPTGRNSNTCAHRIR